MEIGWKRTVAAAILAVAAGTAPAQDSEPERRFDGFVTPLPPEVSELLEGMKVSTAALESILRFQASLITYAAERPELARELRAPIEICHRMLAEFWCRGLPGTFQ